MIGSFVSGTMASLVAKNGTKILNNCLKVYFWMLLLKRVPKAPIRARRALGARRAPKPSAGARRRGAEHPGLLVCYIILRYGIHSR